MIKENLKKIIRLEYLVLLAILILAAIFRFNKLRIAPDWYQDEGEFIRLADYLSKGNLDFLGIRNSMLLIGRPPLFLWILAGIFKLFGTDIIVLRSLTVSCGLASIGICYSFVRQALGKPAAFYAALLMAILPEYIYYNRMGFTYNWTSLWMLIFVFAFWKYLKQDNQKWLIAACLAAGIAFASDYIGIICILVLFLVISLTNTRHLWKIVIAAIPWLVSMLPIFVIAPGDTWHDLGFVFFWGKGGEGSLVWELWRMIRVYSDTVQGQTLIVLGMVGIFTLPDKWMRNLILIMVSGVFVLFSHSRVLMSHYLLPIWPLVMIGLGSFLEKTIAYIYTYLKSSLINLKFIHGWIVNETIKNILGSIGSTLMVFVFVFLPITCMIILNIFAFIIEPVNPSLVFPQVPYQEGYIPAVDAEAVAKTISLNLNPEDFVIAPGVISWMLPCNATDIRTVAVYEYGGTILGMSNLNQDRFTVNSSISNAKYAVVDNSWRDWWVSLAPEIATMLDEVKSWPLIMSQGTLQLFCNPKYCH